MSEDFQPLVVGVSTRALFDLREEHAVFETKGVDAYARLQREREDEILAPGAGFDVVRRLLALNSHAAQPVVEVILLSRNSPDLSLRAFKSIEHHGLAIREGSFTSGRPMGPYVGAWKTDLFLSNDSADVRAATDAGVAAARLAAPPPASQNKPGDEVRFAFDGDAVLFDAESDRIFVEQGLDAFLAHERENALIPMNQGPFGKFLSKLAMVRRQTMRADGSCHVRIAIVTARGAPAHERVVQTFREWGTPADEAHFVGSHAKGPIVGAYGAHIFFDDQERHILGAEGLVPAGLVPGPYDHGELIKLMLPEEG
jgi:5'-nucleotidase